MFWVTGSKTGPDGGGIWGWGGVSVDPVDGNVYVATGNAFDSPENSFYADHVVRLSRMLKVKASNAPGTLIVDDDFGSTPVLFQKSGCPPQFVTEQKNGYLYLYNRDAIATGFHQRIQIRPDGDFIGVPAYSPDTQMVYVPNQAQPPGSPCTLRDARVQAGRQLQAAAGLADDRRGQRWHPVHPDGRQRRRLLQRRLLPRAHPRLRRDARVPSCGRAARRWREGSSPRRSSSTAGCSPVPMTTTCMRGASDPGELRVTARAEAPGSARAHVADQTAGCSSTRGISRSVLVWYPA